MARAVCAFVLAIVAFAAPAQAHPVPFSYLDLRVEQTSIEGSLVAHDFDLAHELNLPSPERLLDPAFAGAQRSAILAVLSARLIVEADGRALAAEWSPSIEPIADRQSLRLRLRYRLDRPFGRLSVTARLFPYDPNHRTFVNVYDGESLTQAILEAARPQFEYFAGTRQGAAAAVRKFVGAGVHHILIGPDHLLFLIGLLLLGGSVKRLALVVTGFTVAHSITLTLAALNIFTPPARLIEPAIALSIVVVGVDNLLVSARQGVRDLRAWMAFGFGFIHGFGFANVLREMDLPERVLTWSLFSFNLGVEIGQLIVVVPVAAALAALWSRREGAARRLAWAGSAIVAAAGVFWFAQRVFFPT